MNYLGIVTGLSERPDGWQGIAYDWRGNSITLGPKRPEPRAARKALMRLLESRYRRHGRYTEPQEDDCCV